MEDNLMPQIDGETNELDVNDDEVTDAVNEREGSALQLNRGFTMKTGG